MKDLILKRIEGLEKYIKGQFDNWREFEEARESMEYDGAENYFGHSDDCFDAGVEYGEWLSAQEELDFLNKLLKEIK